jgi:hypothetical protein
LAENPLFAARRVTSAFLDMLVLLTAPTLLNTAALLVRRPALVVAWEEVPAMTVFAFATRDSRVRIVPPLIK